MGELVMKIVRFVALVAIVMAPAAAAAGPREDLVDGMAKCAAVAENTARLACYDALNPTLKAAEATPPPVAAPPVAAPPPAAPAETRAWYDPGRLFGVSPRAQVAPEQFGSENLTAPKLPEGVAATPENTPPPPIDSITAAVTDYSFTPYGKFILFLDNGQVWRQLDSDEGEAHFSKSIKHTVTISRGMIGSYNLVVDGASRLFKVRRVK